MSRRKHNLFILFLHIFLPVARCFVDYDNEVIGRPKIICNSDTIEMEFKTRKKFVGKVFVRGHVDRPECRVFYGNQTSDGRPIGGIRLNHGACNMDRQRTLADGMMFSTVLVINFHPMFETKLDRAYLIKCMYKEVVKTVQAAIDVSALPTESIAADVPMPTCTYTIRKDTLDGPVLQYARVGDQVIHRWQCDSDEYGVLVNNCYVEDDQGQKQLIIDNKGCHTDRLLLGDPTYVQALNMAYRESFVFKFADRTAVRFQCEIRLCLKDDGGCEGITPPLCVDSYEANRKIDNNTVNRRLRRATKTGDLISQTIFVLDKEDSEKESVLPLQSAPSVCIAQRYLILLGTCLSMSVFIAIALGFYIVYQRFTRLTANLHKAQSSYY